MDKKTVFLCTCIFLAFSVHNSLAVKITSLDVPKSAWNSVKLNCRYDLEGATLYGVKWYKDGFEFFRCMADGRVQEFALPDVKIYHADLAHVGSCHFELTALTERSGGIYQCEVSLDWPTFQTVTQSATLRIDEPTSMGQTHVRTERIPEKNEPRPSIDEQKDSLDEPETAGGSRIYFSYYAAALMYFMIYINYT